MSRIVPTDACANMLVMPLAGTQHQPRALASLCWDAGWRDENLVIAVAVCLAESQGYDGAFHDNLDDDGAIVSRDVGLFQVNIPANQIGTAAEQQLYDAKTNVARARKLYESRGFQPWVAYNSGIALNTDWYTKAGGPTGRYIHRAVRGVGNYYSVHFKLDPTPMLDWYKVPPPPPPPAA